MIESGAKVAVEGSHDERKIALSAVSAYGLESIKSVFLLNGGAIIALLTFLGALYGKDSSHVSGTARLLTAELIPAFKLFIGGVAGAAFTAGLGYLNWSILAQSYWQPADWHNFVEASAWPATPKWYGVFVECTRLLAIATYFGSLFCFGWGAWIVAGAFLKVQI